MRRILSFVFGIFILATVIACSSDDSTNVGDEDPMADISISSVIFTSASVAIDPANDDATTIYTSSLQDNKYTETTRDFYLNEVLETSYIEAEYNYNNSGFLENQNTVNSTLSREYFYDANNVVIAANQYLENEVVLNYRFINQPNNVYFHERLTLPHTDPATEIMRRTIIELNNDGRVIAAGIDSNLDGVIDNVRTFTYSVEGDLLTASDANETVTFSYTEIIDTENFIQNEMIGLRNNSIINGEVFGFLSFDRLTIGSGAYHVSTQEAAAATYEVNTSNFYTKITYPEENNGDFIQMRTIAYLFAN